MGLKSLGLILVLVVASPAFADLVDVGALVYGNPLTTVQGFEVVNETGPVWGCDAGAGTPVCTPLSFVNTSLTVTLSDNTTITATPSGGFSFLPGQYIYGSNAGDNLNQSFLFDPSLTIVSATYSGTVVPGVFQSTNGVVQSTFTSNGAFSETLDLSGGPPLAAVDIVINATPSTSVTPEPAQLAILIALISIVLACVKLKALRKRTE